MSLSIGSINAFLTMDTSKFDSGAQQALRTVSQVSRQFAKVGREAQTAVDGVARIMAASAKFDPQVAGVMKEITNAQNTLAVEAGRALLPAMQSVANVLTGLVRGWQSLSPELRSTIGHVAAMAVGFAGVVAIGGKIASIIGPLAGIAAALLPALPIILAIVGGLAAMILTAVALHAAYRTNFAGIRDYINALMEGFSQLAEYVKTVFKFVLETVGNSFSAMLAMIAKGLHFIGKNDLAKQFEGAAGSIRNALAGAFDNPGPLIKSAMDAGAAAKDAFLSEIKLILKDLHLDGLFDKISSMFKGGGGALPQMESLAEAKKYAEMLKKLDETQRESLQKWNERHGGSAISKHTQETLLDSPFSINAPSFHSERVRTAIAGNVPDSMKFTTQASAARDPKALAYQTKQLEKMQAAADALIDSVSAGLKAVGSMLLSKLGTLGSIVNDAISAAKQGGPLAAVGAVLVDLWAESKGFAAVLQTAEGAVKLAGQALGPFFEALNKVATGILGATSDVIGALIDDLSPILMQLATAFKVVAPILEIVSVLLRALQPIFQLLGTVLSVYLTVFGAIVQGVFAALRGAGFIILGIVQGISGVWNGILGAIQSVFRSLGGLSIFGAKPLDFLNKWADSLDTAKIKTDGLNAAFDALNSMTWDNAAAVADSSANQAKAADQAATALQKLAEELTNIPQGFKVAAARYGATQGPGGGSGDMSLLPGPMGQGTVIYVTVEGSVVSTDGLASSVKKVLENATFRKTGWSGG